MKLGRVRFSQLRIEQSPEWLVSFFGNFSETYPRTNVVIDDRPSTIIETTGIHPAFDDLADGEPTPRYLVDELGIERIPGSEKESS